MKLIKLIVALACVAALVPAISAQVESLADEEAARTPGHADMRTCLPVRPDDPEKNGKPWTVHYVFLIGTGGEIQQAALTKSSGDKELDEEALRAFRKCTFYPAMFQGRAQASWVPVSYTWKP